MAKLSRRKFILVVVSACSSLSIGGWFSLKASAGSPIEFVQNTLKRRLPFLTLEENGIVQFANDFYQKLPGPIDYLAKWEWALKPLDSVLSLFQKTSFKENVKRLEDRIVKQYLMSSDFFVFDGREDRTIIYLGYYDPYNRACANPFAKLYEDDVSA